MNNFAEPFIRRTKRNKHRVRMPKFKLDTIEDYYAYYVVIQGISENLFWNADYTFLRRVAMNKAAYDGWLNAEMNRDNK